MDRWPAKTALTRRSNGQAAEIRAPGDPHARGSRAPAARGSARPARRWRSARAGRGPAITERSSATSCTVRAMGPCTENGDHAMVVGPHRHAAGRRAQAHHVAEAGRIAQRAAHVAAVGDGHHAAGQRHRRAAAGAAARLREIVRIEGGAEDLVEGLRAGPELRRVGLADGDGAGAAQPLDDQRVDVGHVVAVDRRAPRRANPLGRDEVLVGDGQPEEGADRVAPREGGVGRSRLRQRALRREGHDRVDLSVHAFDLGEVRAHHLDHRHLAGADARGQLRRGHEAEIGRHRSRVSQGRPSHVSSGRRCAHGRAVSKAAAACSTARSANRRPTIWSPTGSPAGVKPAGTVAAGWPVKLNG